jgi:hypothetical protein
MESGFPVLICLEGTNFRQGGQLQHVITILGHTLNPFHWSPQARNGYGILPRGDYLPAAEWSDHFLISDDGFGMCQTLQSDVIRNIIVPSKNASLHAAVAMAITPADILCPGPSAEHIAVPAARNALAKIKSQKKWFKRLLDQDAHLVARTLCVARSEYVAWALATAKEIPIEIERRLQSLPAHLWVTELTLPALYTSNGKKLGDIVIDATVNPEEAKKKGKLNSLIKMYWLPGVIQFGPDSNPYQWPVEGPVYMLHAENSAHFNDDGKSR